MSYSAELDIINVTDTSQFKALAGGKVWFGVPDGSPATVAGDRIQIYLARQGLADLAIAQPLDIGPGGQVMYSGTPAQIKVLVPYCVQIMNSLGVQKYYAPKSNGYIEKLISIDASLATTVKTVPTYTDISAALTSATIGQQLLLLGHTLPNVGGGIFDVVSSTGLTANNGTCVINGAKAAKRKTYGTISTNDFGFVDGVTTDATTLMQEMFNIAASPLYDVAKIEISKGLHPIKCGRNDNDFTCAIIAADLINCDIVGQKGAVLKLTSGGSGAPEFGVIRLERCTNVEIKHIEFDGSGIPAQGLLANRSRCIVICNHDVNNLLTDFSPNQRIHIHNNYIHDFGGGIVTALRSEISPLPTFTDTVSVHDNLFKNIYGQDHVVAMIYTRNIHVFNNRAINEIPTITPIDNMFIDVSAGCENAMVENNYVYGFVFGMKCESHINVGTLMNEIRTSKRVTFRNNILEEIGLPNRWDWPGAGGSDTFGIRINGQDITVKDNVIKPRTIGVTAGGLSIGVLMFNSHAQDTLCVIDENKIYSTRYGVLGNHSAASTNFWGQVKHNKLMDNSLYGILVQANTEVFENNIYRSGKSAISTQSTNNTLVRRNRAIDCASINNDVIPSRVVFYQQGAVGISLQEWTDNQIIDSRGASAAHYGYLLIGGALTPNNVILDPGYTSGLLTGITYDQYFSLTSTRGVPTGISNILPRTFSASGIPSGTAPWSTMPWLVGDRAVNTVPAAGQPKAWICTVAGTPGTWVSEGNL